MSIITVDPSTVLEQEAIALKSHTFREWMKLLNMYKHNHQWSKVTNCITQINYRFLVKESFWIKELEDHSNRLDYTNQTQVS